MGLNFLQCDYIPSDLTSTGIKCAREPNTGSKQRN